MTFNDPSGDPPVELDTEVPHPARIWNYWLNGKDNYPADQEAGDAYVRIYPQMPILARAQRLFLKRVVWFLVERGVRQFLDLGTGLPTVDNTHEVAQSIAPECKIVYVDDDPLVLVHARALLTSTPQGACDYIDADVREQDIIVGEAARTLDFSRPVAVMMLGILGHIPDLDEARGVVHRLVERLAPESYLAICDGVQLTAGRGAAQAAYNQTAAAPYMLRPPEQIAGFFDGLELVNPSPDNPGSVGAGLVEPHRWRAELHDEEAAVEIEARAGVGRVPGPRGAAR